MPLPTPNENETHDEFMERCMSNETMQEEYPDEDQRYAVCQTQWEGKEEASPDPEKRDFDKPQQKIAQVRAKDGIDLASRTVVAIVSDETKDRYGDVVKAAGWKLEEFKKNPVIPWAHQTSGGLFGGGSVPLPVGKALDIWIEADKLYAKVQFAEHDFAEEVWRLYRDGYLRAFSVGFLPKKWERMYEGEGSDAHYVGTRFLEQELLEISAVPIPANPNALALAMHKGLELKQVAQYFPDLPEIVIPATKTVVGNGDATPSLKHTSGDATALLKGTQVPAPDFDTMLRGPTPPPVAQEDDKAAPNGAAFNIPAAPDKSRIKPKMLYLATAIATLALLRKSRKENGNDE